ncbi:MAG: COX15/CtaA family protein [Ideonella sp.]|nr:COX15/CtaA family protein [Ideonella sp.]
MLKLAMLAGLIALLPLSWWWLRQRGASLRTRLAALTAITVFLTFDLIVFGAFTRLTDSGLGCPDWPGCYGEASPLEARADIHAAQTAMPSGPVTAAKAWIEMIHRYLAMAVGALIVVAAAVGWRRRADLPHSPWWATVTLVWVIVQGLFGKYTVTLKLYPAIVTLHLLGALVLLGLLVLQHESFGDRPLRLRLSHRAIGWVGALLLLQMALGAWVSTNYAVLACTGFPACNGEWWPVMDVRHGFTVLRELGRAGHGGFLPFEALVAIHMAHRLFAVVAAGGLVWLVARLWREDGPAPRRYAMALTALLVLQVATGLSNVVLDWPLVAALMHTAGAGALTGVLTSLWARAARGSSGMALPAGGLGRPA